MTRACTCVCCACVCSCVHPLVCLHFCGCVIVCVFACVCVSAGLEPVGVVLVQSWTWGRGHRRQLVWRARLATSTTSSTAQSREHTHGVVSATNMEHEAHDAWNSGSSATSSSVTNKLSELGAHHCSLQRQRQTVRSEITFTLQDIQTLYEAWNAPPPSSQELQLDTIWNKFLPARKCSTHCHNLKKFDLEWLTLEWWASLVKIVIKVSLSQLPLYQTRIIQPFMQELAMLHKNLAANPRAYMLITLWAFSVSLFVSMLLSVCVAYFEFTKSPRPKRTLAKQPTLC